jgi:hypothetical protein
MGAAVVYAKLNTIISQCKNLPNPKNIDREEVCVKVRFKL